MIEMPDERRNDVGSKVLVGVVGVLLGMLLSITWATAYDACKKAQTGEVAIGVLQAGQAFISSTLIEVKGELKDIKKLLNERP